MRKPIAKTHLELSPTWDNTKDQPLAICGIGNNEIPIRLIPRIEYVTCHECIIEARRKGMIKE